MQLRYVGMGLLVAMGAMDAPFASDQTCVPPPGFVDTPHPEIAPVEQLLSHTEEITIERPLAVLNKASSTTPLEQTIDRTSDLPGVSGTHRLTQGKFQPGTRRLVCLTDGSSVVEEVLLLEQQPGSSRFRYVVWNYTSPKFPPIHYAVGEFLHTEFGGTRTRVRWTYAFHPDRDRYQAGYNDDVFRQDFLDGQFAQWMRNTLAGGKQRAEALPAQ
jgi:hypothetical protein